MWGRFAPALRSHFTTMDVPSAALRVAQCRAGSGCQQAAVGGEGLEWERGPRMEECALLHAGLRAVSSLQPLHVQAAFGANTQDCLCPHVPSGVCMCELCSKCALAANCECCAFCMRSFDEAMLEVEGKSHPAASSLPFFLCELGKLAGNICIARGKSNPSSRSSQLSRALWISPH